MSTVDEVVDRVYRDFLYAPDSQPVILTLNGAVDDSVTSWVYDDSELSPEEKELLAPGVLIEADRELASITAVSAGSTTLTVRRGVNGTDKAAHSDDTELVLAPQYSRDSVFDAVSDEIVNLWPELYTQTTTSMTSATAPVDAPSDAVELVEFKWQPGTGAYRRSGDIELLHNHPDSATDKAVQFGSDIPSSTAGTLVYHAKTTRPTAGSDDLQSALNVELEWERIVVVGAAASMLSGIDPDNLDSDHITEMLERQGVPVGSGRSVRDGLLAYRSFLISEAQGRLFAEYRTVVHRTHPFGVTVT